MDVMEAIRTRLDIKEYSNEPVSNEVKREILDAGRMSSSGFNAQHWRFILVDDKDKIGRLAEISITGKWVAGANFAVILLTDPSYPFHVIDAGRALTNMQLAAWSRGVASSIFTGYDEAAMRREFGIPNNLAITAVIGFGYPARRIKGRKNRKPLNEVAFHNHYGSPLRLD